MLMLIDIEGQQDGDTVVSHKNGINITLPKVQAYGVRPAWGTVNSCLRTTVNNTVARLMLAESVPQNENVIVKQRYKHLAGNKIRWWFLV